mgnify:CR=1 FL=1
MSWIGRILGPNYLQGKDWGFYLRFNEVRAAIWRSPNELKKQYRNASVITNKRVVFNIKGNLYRLIVDIEYRIGIVFIVWIGSHKEYDKVNVKEINYVKTD